MKQSNNLKFYHSVYLDEDLCQGCINCIKRCPTGAIRVQNGKAHIIKEFCIDCGECIRICPHHAKLAHRSTLSQLDQYKYTVALPAPSLYGQFNHLEDINIVLNAITMLGFDSIFEVSGAAELISEETRKYVADHHSQWPLISSACPTIVRLIRVRFPNLLPHLVPITSPVELAASIARKRAMKETGLSKEDIGIFFISPCPSKVTAVVSPIATTTSEIDQVLAIKDVYPLLVTLMPKAEKHLANQSISGKIGVGWGISGGEAAGVFIDNYIAADGIENVIGVLEDLEDEKLTADVCFIELNACQGGCVGGVFTVENPFMAKAKMKHLKKYLPVARSRCEDYLESLNFYLEHEIEYEPVYQLGCNLEESLQMLHAVDNYVDQLPGLDCGSCGAPTCKALAEDIVRGHATMDDCVYLMRDSYTALKSSQLLKEDSNDRKRNSKSNCTNRGK